ncbi:hypothetical protein GMO_13510 [Gluconobacter morbifer G707]|uniref:Uncharacterized protein n=1 Tax=Gluconobacter morbifer G707 TaxID=1088869 RepID=G6XIE1_9PROT|nr:hypothetical protein GMO_13510 [Gluconobacter morbifer G707]
MRENNNIPQRQYSHDMAMMLHRILFRHSLHTRFIWLGRILAGSTRLARALLFGLFH